MEVYKMKEYESIKRYNLSGKETHTDYYRNGHRVGSSVKRYGLDGKYKYTQNFDAHGRKTGRTREF